MSTTISHLVSERTHHHCLFRAKNFFSVKLKDELISTLFINKNQPDRKHIVSNKLLARNVVEIREWDALLSQKTSKPGLTDKICYIG